MTAPMLTKEAFEAARQFIEMEARPLERARFHHTFDGGPAERVFSTLQRYQNDDGGFGHALDPDWRAQESSALCTSIAFQVLRSTPASSAKDLASAGMAYFLATLDHEEAHWRIIPRSAQDCAHAPWWDQAGREDAFDAFSLNPTAEILGYLYAYQEQVPGNVLSLVTDRVIDHLSGREAISMHELLCCLRLLQTKPLPPALKAWLLQPLTPLVDATVTSDPAQWEEYSLRPVQVVDHPASPFMPGREALVATNLAYEVSSQNEEGSWTPTWTWGGAFPDDWPLAAREWAGVLTLRKLLLLKRFHRIEG